MRVLLLGAALGLAAASRAPPAGVYSFQNAATNTWLRHCYYQAFATPFTAGSQDYQFNIVPALNGASGSVSLQSVNYPQMYFSVINGSFAERNRLGIQQGPDPATASFTVVTGLANASAWSLQSASGLYVALNSGVLSGTCGSSYSSPSGDVFLSDGSNKTAATWTPLFVTTPVTLDCPLRQLGLDYAQALQPWRPAAAFQEIADAFNGGVEANNCSVAPKAGSAGGPAPRAVRGSNEPVAERRVLDFEVPSSGATYYVAAHGTPGVGAEAADGSPARPFASLRHAVEAVRADRAGSEVVTAAHRATIVLQAGKHYLREPLSLGHRDSYLTFQALPGADAVVSGAMPVQGVTWVKAQAPARAAYEWRPGTSDPGFTLETGTYASVQDAQTRCLALPLCAGFTYNDASTNPSGPIAVQMKYYIFYTPGGGSSVWVRNVGYGPGEAPNLWVADLSSLPNISGPVDGLRLPGGQRGIRARYPNVPFIELLGAMQIDADSWLPQPMGTNADYTFNPATPLRNDSSDGYFQTFRLGVGGPCAQRFTPQGSYWCSDNSQGGGPGPYQAPVGMTVISGPSSLPHTPYTSDVTGAVVHSWRGGRWFSWVFLVEGASFDPYKNETSFDFSIEVGGNQGSRGGNSGQEFFIENVLDELDAPSEFFYNASSAQLWLWYNGTAQPPADGSIEITQLSTLVSAVGNQSHPVAGLSFLGLTFADSGPMYLHPHGTPSGGDWAIAREGALFFEGTVGLNVSGCYLARIDGNAVFLSGYTRNASITSNEFYAIGETAVAQWGYTDGSPVAGMGWDASAGNQPRGTVVAYNLAHEVGLWTKQNSFYFQSESFGNVLEGNIAYNGPRAGINFNDGMGGGSVVTRNVLFNFCRESSDHAPFNSWNRQVYQWLDGNGQVTTQKANDTISYNYILGNYHSSQSVDNDDGSSFYETHHNVLFSKSSSSSNGGNSLKSDFGGHSNYHHHNLDLFYSLGFQVDQSAPLAGYQDAYHSNWLYMTGDGPYGDGQTCSGPAATIVYNNTIWSPSGAVTECGQPLAQWQAAGNDPGTTASPWPSDDTVLAIARGLLGL